MVDSVLTLEDGGAAAGQASPARVADFLALLKPRVVSLVVFTGVAGLAAAPAAVHPLIALVAVLCIAVAAGAAGAINMWYDRDIDAVMLRTRARPIPGGRVAAEDALAFGCILAVMSVVVMSVVANLVAGALLAASIGFYVFVYTIWLKRRTPQNIVIGGAAGAFPPMIGWAAATGTVSWEGALLFAIIFLWTPPHFWALALYRSGDYQRAGVPMLPVVAGDGETRRQILMYSLVLAPLAVLPGLTGLAGAAYVGVVTVLGACFVGLAVQVLRARDDRPAKRLFAYSILYLFLVFGMLMLDRGGALLG